MDKLSDMIEQRNIAIDYITDLEKQNKELKKENERLKIDYKVLSCSVGDFGELQEKLEEEQRKNNALKGQIDKMKRDLIRQLNELIDYSTSPSCTSGMKLFLKRIKNWEYSE